MAAKFEREAATLQSSVQARVEDLSVFKVKKETKKSKEHEYQHAAWMVQDETRNVFLGAGLQEDELQGGAGQGEEEEGGGAED